MPRPHSHERTRWVATGRKCCARDFDFPTSQRSAVVGNNEIGLTTLSHAISPNVSQCIGNRAHLTKHAWLCSCLVIFALVIVQTVSGSRSVARDPSAEVERPLRKAFAEMMLSRVW